MIRQLLPLEQSWLMQENLFAIGSDTQCVFSRGAPKTRAQKSPSEVVERFLRSPSTRVCNPGLKGRALELTSLTHSGAPSGSDPDVLPFQVLLQTW